MEKFSWTWIQQNGTSYSVVWRPSPRMHQRPKSWKVDAGGQAESSQLFTPKKSYIASQDMEGVQGDDGGVALGCV